MSVRLFVLAYLFFWLKVIEDKEEYARTRASDSKHLPAVILNVFFLLNRVIMFNIFKSILKI